MKTHQFTSTRICPTLGYGKDATITVDACLHQIGEQAPYFSVTAQINTPQSKRRNDCEACGCMHDDVLKYWPKLAPIVALHLSRIDGQPMHGEANGWYWLAGYYGNTGERYTGSNGTFPKTPEECLAIFAGHVRIPVEEARRLAAVWSRGIEYSEARDQFASWYQEQLPRFKAESDAGIALLDEMISRQREARCPHNAMVPNDDPQHVWKCADCGYVYVSK